MAFNGWKRKCQLTIDSDAADSDRTDYPWLFTVDNLPSEMFDADGSYPALDGGGDIRFSSDADGNTRLSVEIVNFEIDNDPANGKAEIWVKIPTISSATDTTLYVWYGKTGESQPARDAAYGSEDVWSDDYVGVYHFNQDLSVDDLNDSTSYENHGYAYNFSSSDTVDGLYGKALNSDGNYEGIIVPDSASIEPDSVALQATVRLPSSQQNAYAKIVHKGDDQNSPYGAYGLQQHNSATDIAMVIGRSDGQRYSIATGLSTATWMQVYGYCAEYARYTGIVINEGIADNDDHGSGTLLYDTYAMGIVGSGVSQNFWQGDIEELRISNGARSFDHNESFYRTQFGIATYTTVGTPEAGPLVIEPTGIPSSEAWGSPTITTGNVNIAPTGIVSQEAWGTPVLTTGNVNVVPSGIPSAEAWGTPTIAIQNYIFPTGIPSEEAWGTPTVYNVNYILPVGIPSEEAWGTPTITTGGVTVAPTGITSGEAWGTPTVSAGNIVIAPTGIPSEEAWGVPTLHLTIFPESIPSSEAWGVPVLSTGNIDVQATSIPSGEAWGTPTVSVGNVHLIPTGIPSQEAWGIPTIVPGNIFIEPGGIPSGEAWGTPEIFVGEAGIRPPGIPSEEAFGIPTIITGNINIAPTGIPSEEAFGIPTIVAGNTFIVGAGGITSEEAFGIPVVTTGNVFIAPEGIPSEEAFGNPTISTGNVNIVPSGIPSAEAFGVPSIVQHIHPESIISEEAFGTPTLTTGNVNIAPVGIPSEEAFGEPIVRNLWVIAPIGIPSSEAWGTPIVTVKVLNPFHQIMENDLQETFFNTEEFAITCTYIHKSGLTIPDLPIIHDDEFIEVDPGTGVPILSTDPTIMCQSSDFTEHVAKGDKLIISGERFQVVTHQPDGTGVTTLKLHKEKTI